MLLVKNYFVSMKNHMDSWVNIVAEQEPRVFNPKGCNLTGQSLGLLPRGH